MGRLAVWKPTKTVREPCSAFAERGLCRVDTTDRADEVDAEGCHVEVDLESFAGIADDCTEGLVDESRTSN